MLIGYARVSVSTHRQDIDLQRDALKAAGAERVFEETASGGNAEREELARALDIIREGDTLIVWKLDRLGRSIKQLIETAQRLKKKGIGFKSLQENLDTTTPGGKLIFPNLRRAR